METIAVYWEPKIRVYGLSVKTGLAMYTVRFPASRLARWGGRIAGLAAGGREFELANLQTRSDGAMQLCLLLAGDGAEHEVRGLLEHGIEPEEAAALRAVASVELIYFHGPHFQDRYGIVEAAMAPLHKAAIPILAAGCSGTSVYLVVPENGAGAATACLAETFVV